MKELLISSSVLITAVWILRVTLGRRIGSRARYALWLLVLIRLMLPLSLPNSPASVMNYLPERSAADTQQAPVSQQTSGHPALPSGTDQGSFNHTDSVIPTVSETAKPALPVSAILRIVWGIGAFLTGLWMLFSNIFFSRRLHHNRIRLNAPDCPLPVFECGNIPSPCLFGFWKPAIYLNEKALEDAQACSYALLHEEQHYRHKDHIWGLLRCICLAVYWFDPFVWLAAFLSIRDCELACDEGVIAGLNADQKLAYGHCLLAMTPERSTGPRLIAATTMSSGARQMKKRLTAIVKTKKAALWAAVLTFIITAVITGCTFTGAKSAGPDNYSEEDSAGPDNYSGEDSASLNELLEQLRQSVRIQDDAMVLTIPESSYPAENWNIFIYGTKSMGHDSAMSVHYLEDAQQTHAWTSGTDFTITSTEDLLSCIELFLDVSLTDGQSTQELTMDLLEIWGNANFDRLDPPFLPEDEAYYLDYPLTENLRVVYSVKDITPAEADDSGADGHVYLLNQDEDAALLGPEDSQSRIYPWAPVFIGDRVLFGWYNTWGTTMTTSLWTIENGRCIQLDQVFEYLTYEGDGQFTCVRSAYDAVWESYEGEWNSYTTGHTQKRYWLYWDEETRSFLEYGAKEITREELLSLDNPDSPVAAQILDAINEKGYTVKEIFLRDNGIVNINYTQKGLSASGYEYESYHNATLQLNGNNGFSILTYYSYAEDILGCTDQEGIYFPAAYPDIAVFP